MTTSHAAPEHLSERSQALWDHLVAEYRDAFEPEHLAILELTLDALDRATEARELLAKEGLTVEGARGNLVPHPAIRIEASSRDAALRGFRTLGLDGYDAS